MLLPKAHCGFSTVTSYVAKLTLNDIAMKNISLGCAALHLHTITGQSNYHKLALLYYGRALSSVGSRLQMGAITNGERGDALVFTMALLCIFTVSVSLQQVNLRNLSILVDLESRQIWRHPVPRRRCTAATQNTL